MKWLRDLPAYREIEAFLEECAAHAEAEELDLPPLTLRRQLTLTDVRFGYGPAMVLEGVSLSVTAGEITAIAGLSGAGRARSPTW